MMEAVYKVFGDTLPDKDTFFATNDNPMSLLDMRKGFKTWDSFVHEYFLYVKSVKAPAQTKTVAQKAPSVVEKAVPNETK